MSINDPLTVQSTRKSRLLITLIVDVSISMIGDGVAELNAALKGWASELRDNDSLASAGEIAMVSFGHGGVQVVDVTGHGEQPPARPYVPVSEFDPPILQASGTTPMVEAIQLALKIMAQRKLELAAIGVQMSHRPLMHLITDGVPTDSHGVPSDSWRDLAPLLRQHAADKQLQFFAIGVKDARREVLTGLSPNGTFMLDGLPFQKVLDLVSTSIGSMRGAGRDAEENEIFDQVKQRVDATTRMDEWLNSVQ